MHRPPHDADSDLPEDISYEDFDDVPLSDNEEVLDLDALDTPEAAAGTGAPAKPAAFPPRPPLERPNAPRMPARPASPGERAPARRLPPPAPVPLRLPFAEGAGSATPEAVSVPGAEVGPAPARAASVPPPDTPAAAPMTEAPSEPVPVAEAVPAPEAVPQEETAPAPAPEPDWVYLVLLALPEDLSVVVLELRSAGEVIDMPPPGIVLTGSFRAADRPALEAALARWAREQLPLQITVTSVVAEVIGSQQYVAAWTLQPAAALQQAQRVLLAVLQGLINPLPEAPLAFEARLSVGDRVPARRYPHVVGRMQRDFEPVSWQARQIVLVRKAAEADAGAWEIVQRFEG